MAWHGRGLCLLLFRRLGLETCHMIFRVSVFLFLWKTVISIYMGIAMNLCIPFESIATFVILIQINEDGRFRLLAFFSIYVFSLFKFSIRYLSPFWLWLYLNIFKLLWVGIFFFLDFFLSQQVHYWYVEKRQIWGFPFGMLLCCLSVYQTKNFLMIYTIEFYHLHWA